jgi:short-subunit dehydrogenase
MNIIITGASAGIGFALAKLYAKQGVNLGLIGRSSEKLAVISATCREQGAQVVAAAIDVTDTEALKNWLLAFDAQFPVDLLIANAGVTSIMPDDGAGESWAAVSQVLDVNIYGVFNTVYPLIAPMRQRQKGQIALVSSLAAFRGMPISPAYCATKAAVKSYGEALRGWLQQDNVKVNVICPGFVKSQLSDQFTQPKILMMSAEEAAKIIQRGLEKNNAVISFPFPLDLGMKILGILPAWFVNWIFTVLNYSAKHKKNLTGLKDLSGL